MANQVNIPLDAANSFDLPPICVVTGERDVEWHTQSFQWTPQWAMMAIAFLGLIGIIIAMVKRRRARVELPYAPAAWERLRKGRWIGYASLALMLPAAMVVGPLWMVQLEPLSGLLVMVALFIAPFIILHLTVTTRGPRVVEITDTHILLDLPSPLAAAELRHHFQGR